MKNEIKNKISQSIKVIKPKPIKPSSLLQNNKKDSDSLSSEEELQEFEGSESEVEVRQENSLGQLTKNFIKYIKNKGKINININDLVQELTVKKRRIYDITNVLQGIGYIKKKGKNEILWIKNNLNINKNSNSNSTQIIKSQNQIQSKISSSVSEGQQNKNQQNEFIMKKNEKEVSVKEIEELIKENSELDKTLEKFKEEFNSISQKADFPKYGYITFNDLCNMTVNEGLDILTVKAPKGTVVNVIDKEDSKKALNRIQKQMEAGKILPNENLLNTLRNEHHIFFDSPNEELKLYRVTNGHFSEIISSYQTLPISSNNQINSAILNEKTPNTVFNINTDTNINTNVNPNNNKNNNNINSNIKSNLIIEDKEALNKNIINNSQLNNNINNNIYCYSKIIGNNVSNSSDKDNYNPPNINSNNNIIEIKEREQNINTSKKNIIQNNNIPMNYPFIPNSNLNNINNNNKFSFQDKKNNKNKIIFENKYLMSPNNMTPNKESGAFRFQNNRSSFEPEHNTPAFSVNNNNMSTCNIFHTNNNIIFNSENNNNNVFNSNEGGQNNYYGISQMFQQK